MKTYKKIIAAIVLLAIVLVPLTLHKKQDLEVMPFPSDLSMAVAEAASPSGQGIFLVTSCSNISNPQNGNTWCFISGTTPQIFAYFNNAFQAFQPTGPYDIAYYFSGVPTGSKTITLAMAETVSLAANLSGSVAKLGVAATSSTVFSIQKNGVQVATVTFAPSGTTGTFSTQAAISIVNGDLVSLVAPGSSDATAANVSITLKGTRS